VKIGKSTGAIHGLKDQEYLSVNYPIFQTTSFGVKSSEEYKKFISDDEDFYIYTRYRNPSIRNVETKLAHLEKGEDALVFSSGMAAITSSILSFVTSGNVIAASNRLYGMTYRFLRDYVPKFGIKTVFLNEEEIYNVNNVVPEARVVYFETPVNPTTDILSIKRIVESAKKIEAVTITDNTFASPINQNPIEFGVDLVVHSATKYIGGHSDVMAGAVVGSKNYIKKIHNSLKAFGGCINPVDAYLLDRSLKTLHVRIQTQNINAQKLAEIFCNEDKIKSVAYPGIQSFEKYELASAQMKGFGGMVCVELENLEKAKTLCDNLQIALNATSLGGVETLVSIPVLTSHIKMSEKELQLVGVTEGMVRISIGLEDPDDLISDFNRALSLL
jgi:cystathionine beta-lyase/cystathionine gamma-synthase